MPLFVPNNIFNFFRGNSYRDNDVAFFMPLLDIAVRLGSLFQWIASIAVALTYQNMSLGFALWRCIFPNKPPKDVIELLSIIHVSTVTSVGDSVELAPDFGLVPYLRRLFRYF